MDVYIYVDGQIREYGIIDGTLSGLFDFIEETVVRYDNRIRFVDAQLAGDVSVDFVSV